MIVKPTRTLCWAAKWYGEKKIHFRNENDPDFIEAIYNMVDEADGIIHYNGKSFDMKHLNRDFLLNAYPPPSSYKNIDLLLTMRQNFKMASNKLEWTSVQLGYDGKVSHRGIQLWFDCMDDDPKAWREMKKYNIQDVVLLEQVYKDLLPWIKNHPNWGHYVDGKKLVCKNCGSTDIKKDGWERRTVISYQRYRCNSCLKPLRGRTAAKRDEDGKELPRPSTV